MLKLQPQKLPNHGEVVGGDAKKQIHKELEKNIYEIEFRKLMKTIQESDLKYTDTDSRTGYISPDLIKLMRVRTRAHARTHTHI